MAEDTTVPIEIEVPEPFLAGTGLGEDKEAYGVAESTIRMSITLHPDDGHERGRLVTVAATTHNDAPLVRSTRFADLGPLPTVAEEVLRSLIGELPERRLMAIERYKLAQAEAMRKETEKKANAAAAASRAAKTKQTTVAKTAKATPTASVAAPASQPERAGIASLPLFSEDQDNG